MNNRLSGSIRSSFLSIDVPASSILITRVASIGAVIIIVVPVPVHVHISAKVHGERTEVE